MRVKVVEKSDPSELYFNGQYRCQLGRSLFDSLFDGDPEKSF